MGKKAKIIDCDYFSRVLKIGTENKGDSIYYNQVDDPEYWDNAKSDEDIPYSELDSTDNESEKSIDKTIDGNDYKSVTTTDGIENITQTEQVFTLSTLNSNVRDVNVELYDRTNHRYSINGMYDNIQSVTQYIDHFFSTFDEDEVSKALSIRTKNVNSIYYGKSADEIRSYWEKLRRRGSIIHSYISDYYENSLSGNLAEKGNFSDQKEVNVLTAFDKYNAKINQLGYKPYRSEYMIYNEYLLIAGTVDAVYTTSDNDFIVVDWKITDKSTTDLKKTNHDKKKTKRKKLLIGNNTLNKYKLQVALYSFMLKTSYQINITKASVVLLRTNGTFEEVSVDLNEFENILDTILNMRKEDVIFNLQAKLDRLKSYNIM